MKGGGLRYDWRYYGVLAALNILVIDQVSKWYVLQRLFVDVAREKLDFAAWLLTPQDRVVHVAIRIAEFFNISLVWNTGVSFGMMQSQKTVAMLMLSGIALFAIIGFCIWAWREPRRMVVMPSALIVGGAAGNLLDRFRFGAVLDFLDFHAGKWHWPSFNIADAAIVIGVAMLLWDMWRQGCNKGKNNKSQNSAIVRGSIVDEQV